MGVSVERLFPRVTSVRGGRIGSDGGRGGGGGGGLRAGGAGVE